MVTMGPGSRRRGVRCDVINWRIHSGREGRSTNSSTMFRQGAYEREYQPITLVLPRRVGQECASVFVGDVGCAYGVRKTYYVAHCL